MEGFRNGLSNCVDYVLKCNCFCPKDVDSDDERDAESWHSLPLVWANDTHKAKAGSKHRSHVKRPKVVPRKRLRNPSEFSAQCHKIPRMAEIRKQPDTFTIAQKHLKPWPQNGIQRHTYPVPQFNIPTRVELTGNPDLKYSPVSSEALSYYKRSITQYKVPRPKAPLSTNVRANSSTIDATLPKTSEMGTQTEKYHRRRKNHSQKRKLRKEKRRKDREEARTLKQTEKLSGLPKDGIARLSSIGIDIGKYIVKPNTQANKPLDARPKELKVVMGAQEQNVNKNGVELTKYELKQDNIINQPQDVRPKEFKGVTSQNQNANKDTKLDLAKYLIKPKQKAILSQDEKETTNPQNQKGSNYVVFDFSKYTINHDYEAKQYEYLKGKDGLRLNAQVEYAHNIPGLGFVITDSFMLHGRDRKKTHGVRLDLSKYTNGKHRKSTHDIRLDICKYIMPERINAKKNQNVRLIRVKKTLSDLTEYILRQNRKNSATLKPSNSAADSATYCTIDGATDSAIDNVTARPANSTTHNAIKSKSQNDIENTSKITSDTANNVIIDSAIDHATQNVTASETLNVIDSTTLNSIDNATQNSIDGATQNIDSVAQIIDNSDQNIDSADQNIDSATQNIFGNATQNSIDGATQNIDSAAQYIDSADQNMDSGAQNSTDNAAQTAIHIEPHYYAHYATTHYATDVEGKHDISGPTQNKIDSANHNEIESALHNANRSATLISARIGTRRKRKGPRLKVYFTMEM